ncbi:MAG: hypothetical protein NVS3B26_21210 [Mycobacteriales bacterium]
MPYAAAHAFDQFYDAINLHLHRRQRAAVNLRKHWHLLTPASGPTLHRSGRALVSYPGDGLPAPVCGTAAACPCGILPCYFRELCGGDKDGVDESFGLVTPAHTRVSVKTSS